MVQLFWRRPANALWSNCVDDQARLAIAVYANRYFFPTSFKPFISTFIAFFSLVFVSECTWFVLFASCMCQWVLVIEDVICYDIFVFELLSQVGSRFLFSFFFFVSYIKLLETSHNLRDSRSAHEQFRKCLYFHSNAFNFCDWLKFIHVFGCRIWFCII